MNREVHVRFCEGVGVKFPRATRPLIYTRLKFNLAQDLVSCQWSVAREKRKLMLALVILEMCLSGGENVCPEGVLVGSWGDMPLEIQATYTFAKVRHS